MTEAVYAAIGSALLSASAAAEVLAVPADAWQGDYRAARDGIERLMTRGAPVDVVSLAAECRGRGLAGDAIWLAQAMSSVPTSDNVSHYCGLVTDAWRKSRLKAALEGALASVDNADTADAAMATTLALIEGAAGAEGGGGFSSAEEISRAASDKADTYDGSTPPGLPTGLASVDAQVILEPTHLVIGGARPGMGKSAFAFSYAHEVARKGGVVAAFSLEMNKVECFMRLACAEAGIDSRQLKAGELAPERKAEYYAALRGLSQLHLYVNDTGGITLPEVASRCRLLKRRHKRLDLIVIDYLQLMGTAKASRDENRDQALGVITKGLKELAKKLGCVVLVLSQLNRALEMRPNKRPTLSDLRESGNIEQDADEVLFFYRPSYYGDTGDDEIIIGKSRHGEPGTAYVEFEQRYTRFVGARPKSTRQHYASNGGGGGDDSW